MTVGYDVLGFSGEIEIGVYSISEDIGQNFTPYVLDGADTRPIATAFELGPYNLVDEPFEVGSGTGNFKLDFRIDSPGITFEGTEVPASHRPGLRRPRGEHHRGRPGRRTRDARSARRARLDLRPPSTASSTPRSACTSCRRVELTIFGVDLAIGPFDIEMEYPLLEGQEIQFDDVAMEFDIPEAPEDPEDPSRRRWRQRQRRRRR